MYTREKHEIKEWNSFINLWLEYEEKKNALIKQLYDTIKILQHDIKSEDFYKAQKTVKHMYGMLKQINYGLRKWVNNEKRAIMRFMK